jgi:hypothetical protein
LREVQKGWSAGVWSAFNDRGSGLLGKPWVYDDIRYKIVNHKRKERGVHALISERPVQACCSSLRFFFFSS